MDNEDYTFFLVITLFFSEPVKSLVSQFSLMASLIVSVSCCFFSLE